MLQKLVHLKKRIKIKGRDQRAVYSSIANVCAQVIQIATSLISVPLTLTYLDEERFALWIAITTLISFLYFADLGIGIGMQDRMTKAVSKNDHMNAKSAFQISVTFSSTIALVVIGIAFFAIPQIPWMNFFDITSGVSELEVESCIVVFVASTAIGIVAATLQRAFIAFQESYIVAFASALSKVVGLLGLLTAVFFHGSLSALIIGTIGISNLFLLIISLCLLLKNKRWLFTAFRKSFNVANMKMLKEMVGAGILGLGASIAFYIVGASVPFVLTKKYGAESIVAYSLVSRLTSMATIFLIQALSPLWPALTDAVVKNDWQWVRSRYSQSLMLVASISTISVLILAFFGNAILRTWTQKSFVEIDISMLAPILFMMMLSQWNAVLSVFLNGLSRFKSQATWGLTLSIAALGLALLIPSSSNHSTEVWIVGAGYFFRCAVMHLELRKRIG